MLYCVNPVCSSNFRCLVNDWGPLWKIQPPSASSNTNCSRKTLLLHNRSEYNTIQELSKDAVANSLITAVSAVVQYLSDCSRLVVLSAVGPSIFTFLLLQTREDELSTWSQCRQVLNQVQLIPATTARLIQPAHLLTRRQQPCYFAIYIWVTAWEGRSCLNRSYLVKLDQF